MNLARTLALGCRISRAFGPGSGRRCPETQIDWLAGRLALPGLDVTSGPRSAVSLQVQQQFLFFTWLWRPEQRRPVELRVTVAAFSLYSALDTTIARSPVWLLSPYNVAGMPFY